eukprot:gene49941-66894_t
MSLFRKSPSAPASATDKPSSKETPTMGSIVGAAIVSHHPGLMQCEEFRVLQGAGADSDLIPGYARLREKIATARPDVVILFDSHWFTTGYHLVDGAARYEGTYISDEMPWYLHGVPYDYRGHPDLALAIEAAHGDIHCESLRCTYHHHAGDRRVGHGAGAGIDRADLRRTAG